MKKLKLKQRLVTIIIFLSFCGVIGSVTMLSGIVPIKASSGHWTITKWILDFSKSRSVATYSIGIDTPPLDDAALVMKGAGHYETGCVQCHGSPTQPASPIALSMTATPPSLPSKIKRREPAELFFIIKHGIKFTGMPAWPAQNRDDEVWAMVAFLLELPQMDEKLYRDLTFVAVTSDSPPRPDDVSFATWESCQRCHGADGLGRGQGVFPKLAGQSREYLLASLRAYATGERHSGMMQPVAAILSAEELNALAHHYAGLPVGRPADDPESGNAPEMTPDRQVETSGDIDRGKSIASSGIPGRNVPSCIDCHGPVDRQRSSKYPRLASQSADFLILQLELFQAGHRGGTEAAHLMQRVARHLTKADIRDVAAYYSSLPEARI